MRAKQTTRSRAPPSHSLAYGAAREGPGEALELVRKIRYNKPSRFVNFFHAARTRTPPAILEHPIRDNFLRAKSVYLHRR